MLVKVLFNPIPTDVSYVPQLPYLSKPIANQSYVRTESSLNVEVLHGVQKVPQKGGKNEILKILSSCGYPKL